MPRLVCPRISPEWELAAQLALVKPKPYTKSKIAHRDAKQSWTPALRQFVESCLGGKATPTFPKAGDAWLTIDLPAAADNARAKRVARKLSRCLPDLWFTLDGLGGVDEGKTLYLRGGVVYQRTGRYNLELVRANKMRLRRAVRFGFLGDVDNAIPRPDYRKNPHAPAQRDR
jgi:hypothetical protein